MLFGKSTIPICAQNIHACTVDRYSTYACTHTSENPCTRSRVWTSLHSLPAILYVSRCGPINVLYIVGTHH